MQTEQFDNKVTGVGLKENDASSALLSLEANSSAPFQHHDINWTNLAPAVAACSKAGVDVVGLLGSGGLDLAALPALVLEGTACFTALTALKKSS